MNTHRIPQRGFTLVELLIALALISLITLLLFSGLRLGSRAWEAVDAAAERTTAVRLAHGFLTRTLSQLRVTTVTLETTAVTVFAGDHDRLEFAAPLSEHVGSGGLYVLRLTLETHAGTPMLLVTRWLLHPEILHGTDDVPAWEPLSADAAPDLAQLPIEMDAADGAFGRTPLLATVDTFQLSYYGIADGETEPAWRDDWLEQPHLPLLLRIRLTSPTQAWPELVIALPRAST
ncbi:general secretion pathway protein GspJ [Chromatium okenii]|uniref:prepilin-type N-terminal cleavage/methylation domain-containing protein n=1 Tax=Chromatium okenii TaxID=61644 RepID=UPI0019046A62|nr:prepilin-type N-terminal cleavage/methylation domain-containing protein [Chromatium okenii]MBK1641828.1 general secretion pathway protein GspJ [Chromatium okenii]